MSAAPEVGGAVAVRVFLGPPGTGKTTTLMGTLSAELEAGVSPGAIAFVSFTKAAVTEAADRACKRFELPRRDLPLFRTVHSMALHLMSGTGERPEVFGSKDWAEFGAECRYDLSIDDRTGDDAAIGAPPLRSNDDELRAMYEFQRSRRLSPDRALLEYAQVMGAHKVTPARLREYVAKYEAFKQARRKLDFADMLEYALDGEVPLAARVLIVDEAQDLSPLQIAVVEQWVAQSPRLERLYVAGDDDQTIMEFQGAAPEWLMGLAKRHPTTVLSRSYRVPRAAHAVAQTIIGRNATRIRKAYTSTDEPGSYVVCSEEEAIASITPGEPTFVLSRNIKYLARQCARLMAAHVPFVCERGGRGPLGAPKLLAAVETASRLRRGLEVEAGALSALLDFVPSKAPRSALGEVSSEPLLERGIKAAVKRAGGVLTTAQVAQMGGERMIEAIRRQGAIAVLAGKLPPVQRAYLTALLGDRDALPEPHVVVTTIHASKGREADHVIVLAVHAAGSERSMKRSATREGENRTAYVAVTRTKRRLTVARVPDGELFGYPYPGLA